MVTDLQGVRGGGARYLAVDGGVVDGVPSAGVLVGAVAELVEMGGGGVSLTAVGAVVALDVAGD